MKNPFKKPDIVERARRVNMLGQIETWLISERDQILQKVLRRPEEVSIGDDTYRFVLDKKGDYEKAVEWVKQEIKRMLSGGPITRRYNGLSGVRS